MNYQYPLLQNTVPILSCGIENIISSHEILLAMYQDYIIDNQILFPGAAIVEIGLTAGTQCVDNTQRNTNRCV